MPLPKYNGRKAEVYFPSSNFLQEWKAEAKAARMPLSTWIFSTVESSRAGRGDEAVASDQDLQTLREETRRLRRGLESTTRELELKTAELFKLKNEIFLKDQLVGVGEFDERLVNALRSGGSWPAREILAELQVDPRDAEAVQIVTRQLQILQDLGLVRDGPKGWMWIK